MAKVKIEGNASGTGTFTIAAPAGNTDRTLTLPDEAGTVLTSASDITSQARTGTPAFVATALNTDQAVSAGVYTKIQFPTEVLDTHGDYDNTTNYRYTPSVAGWYQFTGFTRVNTIASETLAALTLYKNGSAFQRNQLQISSAALENMTPNFVSTLVYANGSTDYFEMYYYSGLNTTLNENTESSFDGGFSAFLVRAD